MSEENHLILVVDDNEMNRDMLSRRLQRQGFAVELAENGQQALDMMYAGVFHLVLLDVMMPRMNGYEVLEHMKADPTLKSIPVIMVSAVDDLDSVVKCIEMGAEDYLFKPFNPVLLRARVSASLRRSTQAVADAPAELHQTLTDLKTSVDQLAAVVGDNPLVHDIVSRTQRALDLVEGS